MPKSLPVPIIRSKLYPPLSGVLHELALNSKNVYLIGLGEAFEAELALRQGELAKAMAWAEQREQSTEQQLTNFKKAFSACLEAQNYMVKSLTLTEHIRSRKCPEHCHSQCCWPSARHRVRTARAWMRRPPRAATALASNRKTYKARKIS